MASALGLGLGLPFGGATSPYDADAGAYFAAMTTAPDDTRKALINTLILGLKSDGVWSQVEWLSLIAAHDAQAARLNVKAPAQVASLVNSPTFTTDRGYTGDAVSTALNLPNAYNALSLFQQDSSFWYIANRAAITPGSTQFIFGQVATSTIEALNPSSAGTTSFRHGSVSSDAVADASVTGRYCATRTSSTGYDVYKNGALLTSFVRTSSVRSASPPSLLRTGTSFSNAQISVFALGAGLSGADAVKLDTRINTYLTAIGA